MHGKTYGQRGNAAGQGYRMNQKINYEENLRVLALSFVPILPVRKLGMELGEGK